MSTWITKRAKELGIPQVDAKASLFLEVVASDIKTAVAKNPTCCAFANATKRGIPGVQRVYFYRSCAWIEYEDKLMRYTLPTDVREQIEHFDKTKAMKPGVYCLSRPSKANTLDGHRDRNRKSSRKKKRSRGVTNGARAVVSQDNVRLTQLGNPKATPTREDKVDVRSANPAKWPTK